MHYRTTLRSALRDEGDFPHEEGSDDYWKLGDRDWLSGRYTIQMELIRKGFIVLTMPTNRGSPGYSIGCPED